MFRYLLLAIALVVCVLCLLTVFVMAMIALALACCVGIPVWLVSRAWLRRHGIIDVAQAPVDRVKRLYVEGKIDMFEFERRVAHLISVDH